MKKEQLQILEKMIDLYIENRILIASIPDNVWKGLDQIKWINYTQ